MGLPGADEAVLAFVLTPREEDATNAALHWDWERGAEYYNSQNLMGLNLLQSTKDSGFPYSMASEASAMDCTASFNRV